MKIFLYLTFLFNLYNIKWENIHIKIPLLDSVTNYFDLPKATLYDNNSNVINSPYYYEKGVNHTSLKVVSSKHVKTYRVDYRITFYELNIKSTQTITFEIIDNIPPEIIKYPTIIMPVKSKLLTEKEIINDIIVKDNYYPEEELIINILNLANVNVNYPGDYIIKISVMDPSYNKTELNITYKIISNIPPEIKYNEPIYLNYGQKFNIYEHFKFNDPYDNSLQISYDDTLVDYQKLGTYPITVTAKNQFDLFTIVQTSLIIVDKQSPELILNDKPIINVKQYDETILKQFIIYINDNYDKLTIDDVNIIHNINFDLIGKYNVIYEVKDSSLNVTTKQIQVEIKDLEKPVITPIKQLKIDVHSNNIIWLNYFNIIDNYDNVNDLTIKFNDKNINYNNIGKYILEVEVQDLSKNINRSNFIIEIIDQKPPEVVQIKDIIITDFTPKDEKYFLQFFNIQDNYTKRENININFFGSINYNLIGEYFITIIFSDESNNETSLNTSIFIIDAEKPEINLYNETIYYYVNDNKPNYYNNIKNVLDNYTKKEDLEITIIDHVNYQKIGKYQVEYIVRDQSYNETLKTIDVIVDKNKKQLMKGKNITLNKFQDWYLGLGIEFSDDVVKIETIPHTIYTNTNGKKEILYIAYDERGNSEQFLQIITVKNEIENKFNIILIITINLLGIAVIIYTFIKSKKDKNL